MDFIEKNLEDIIFETKNDLINKRGLDIRGKKFRDVDFDYNGGLVGVDLFTYDYKFDGIWFKQQKDYSLIKDGFNIRRKNIVCQNHFVDDLPF